VASRITNFIRCQLARQRLALYRREFNAARALQCMYRVYRARLAMWDRRCIGWEFMHQGLGPQRLYALIDRYALSSIWMPLLEA